MFYSQGEELDKTLGCVGHLRIDFGRTGTEFWHTWHEHNENLLNTEEFKVEFDEILSELRKQGPLKSRASMAYFCIDQGAGPLDGNDYPQYGFTTESENYKYYLRCNPQKGDYNGYLYIYDKREQQLRARGVVGRTSYSNGECFIHTDSASYLREIREELEYRNTSGFHFETITDNPAIRKAVDDEIFDLFGENNYQEAQDYNTPQKGMKFGGI